MRTVSTEQRAKVLEAFRVDPEPGSAASFTRAAAASGLDRRTCRRAWLTGWPGFRAVRETIEVDKTLARAALRREVLQQRLDEASRLAQEDAAEERAREGLSLRSVALAARNGLAALHAERIHEYQKTLARLMQAEDPNDAKARGARRAYREIVDIIRGLAEAADRAQVMQARLLGSPTVILGGGIDVRPVTPVNADAATLAAEVEAAQRAVEEMKALEAKKGGDDGNTSALTN